MGRLRNTLRLFYVALRKELYDIATSLSSVILIVGGMVAYGLLYNLMYHPNVVHEAPVVVVDNSHTSLSRHFISLIDASPKAVVVASVADMSDARSMLSRGRAEAILYLPNDTDRRIARGEQAIFVTLSSTATLLYYEATVEAIMEAMLSLDDAIRDDILRLLPAPVVATIGQGSSTEVVGNALFNPTKGYADYLIPVVFVVIIFQTMVMVVSMHSAERNARRALFVGGGSVGFCGRITIVLARSATYCAIYGLLSLFLVGLLPIIFRLPHLASGYNLIMLMCPFMLATSLFGQAFGRLFSDREAPIVLITFFSVGLIFLSGISYPLELMPIGWQSLHYLLPAAPATLAFVELSTMGSSLADIAPHLGILWLQALGYLLLATIPKQGFR
jgi:ABC-2 type transport system permease protein